MTRWAIPRFFRRNTERAAPAAPLLPPDTPLAETKRPGLSFHHLTTGRGNWLAAGDRRIVMGEVLDLSRAIIAVLPNDRPHCIFLLAPDGRPIEVQSDGLCSIAVSAFRVQTDVPGIVRLKHPFVPLRYMAVTKPGQGGPDGRVIFDSMGGSMLDTFALVRLQDETAPAGLRVIAAELGLATAQPFRAETLLGQLRDGSVRAELAETLIRVLPRDELARLAAALLDRPADLDMLRQAMPENPWLQRVLPALARWNTARGPVSPDGTMGSAAADQFAGDALEGYGQPQAGFALTGLARMAVSPRRGACLLAAARNEGPYLLEWLAYHRAIGFEHAFIYTNDNWDGSDRLLAQLARHGVITLVYNEVAPHFGPQYKAYSHALSLLPQILDYRWTAVLDLDEYAAFDTRMFAGIGDFIGWQETQPVDAIGLCWQMFVGSRQDLWEDTPTLQRFVRREAGANPHVKSLFRSNRFWHSQAHYPYSTLGQPFVFRNESGLLHHHPGVTDRIPAFADPPSAQVAWVNHYLLRSAREALWKLSRGHGDWQGNFSERQAEMARFVCRTFVTLADRPDLVEDRRIASCAAGQEAELARLRGLPGVAEIEDGIKHGFAERLENMAAAFITAPTVADEPLEFGRFREILRAQESQS